MSGKPLRMALIDKDGARRLRMEALAAALGVKGSSSAALPVQPQSGHAIVLLVDDFTRSGIAAAREAFPAARVVAASPNAAQADAVSAFRAGADDFVWLGAGDAELADVLLRHVRACVPPPAAAPGSEGLIGNSAAIAKLRAFIAKLAPTTATVLITGETGVGKDVAAVQIHRMSRRAAKPLVALNCAAIPEALIEGELFGYERGAFSGAHAAYPGKLKLADGGTLLLDEIGELSPAGQAKLLRAIETREAWRLGGRAPIQFDVRIIAVTNRDLADDVHAGRFREDLFYRLVVSQIRLPPLRERCADIEPIAHHLLRQLAKEANCRALRLDGQALACLEAHSWPGNVRELRNALEFAMINAEGESIRMADLPVSFAEVEVRRPPPEAERARLIVALNASNGNKSLAALQLNCSRMTLYRRLQRHGLDRSLAIPA